MNSEEAPVLPSIGSKTSTNPVRETGANSRLTGSSGDDILITGSTDFDANDAVLRAIIAEWSSPLPSYAYATRVANVRNGSGSLDRLNGASFHTAATVHDDGVADTLSGK